MTPLLVTELYGAEKYLGVASDRKGPLPNCAGRAVFGTGALSETVLQNPGSPPDAPEFVAVSYPNLATPLLTVDVPGGGAVLKVVPGRKPPLFNCGARVNCGGGVFLETLSQNFEFASAGTKSQDSQLSGFANAGRVARRFFLGQETARCFSPSTG